ncbi:hypothetical protein H7I77_00095 [Mycolicibacterium novocastrense]|uniref:Uncharacterized protein n=1 Tax=Mycolicibacterium novocastrense TaxID=59813 RepID=A0AAW5SCP6_MYCNV|nr:hypothetical protein [Mycolicibacterium novocastrense]MCV7021761.1 hypothetical protein [Mycolicibacterium novocastrense]GAT11682.1 uncharacterized protein RMCN_4815 [Mycolicibacterium novocastrense]
MKRFPARTLRLRRFNACTAASMPPGVDPAIRRVVHTVYSTDLGLPEDWTATQRAEFIDAKQTRSPGWPTPTPPPTQT